MSHDDVGPPGGQDGEGRSSARPATVEQVVITSPNYSDQRSSRQCSSTTQSWRRRREAALRLPQLDCGCFDPWLHRCTRPSLSDRMIDGGRAAALHLLAAGYAPILRLDTLRALYRRGGDDRQLARELFDLVGGDDR